jgi:hypothetical protein
MENSKVIQPEPDKQPNPLQQGSGLPANELKKLTDFFSLLIQIDRRVNVTKTYAKPNK